MICFGGLEYDEIQVQIVDKRQKSFKNNVQTKTIKKISFEEFYRAIEVIKELNYLMVQKDTFVELVDQKYEERFQSARSKVLSEFDSKNEDYWIENIDIIDEMFKEVPEDL